MFASKKLALGALYQVGRNEADMKLFGLLLALAGFVVLANCGSSDPMDCYAPGEVHEKCYGTNSGAVTVRCEAEVSAGTCSRVKYWVCYADHECSDTNDTYTIAKLEDCLATNEACE